MADLPITREEALALLEKFDPEKKDFTHYLESEAVMRGLAKHFGEDVEYWGMLGLLHDVDWGLVRDNVKEHGVKTPEILRESGFDKEFIDIVISHMWGFDCGGEGLGFIDKKRTRKIEHCLAAAETITGLIYSYALMRDKKISDMNVKGLKKKFKDKAFAAGCNRDIIREIEETGLELGEFFQIAIDSVKGIKEEIGLE